MSSRPISLTVAARPGKKALKNAPSTITITTASTVEDVKKQIAKTMGIRDHNQIAIMDPIKQGILKDRLALLSKEDSVMSEATIMIKDLGPQISWKTVFIIEYAGPIIIHLLFPLIRPYVYKNAGAMSPAQWASSVMMTLHFLKREFETEFVHHFSAATMPRFNVLKNSAHYWLAGGLNIAYWVYSPTSMAAKSESSQLLILGLTLFSFGELLNLYTHLVLSRLRTPGGTERGIPQGFGFNLVTCPNYLFETIAWTGILLVTQSISTLLFVGLAVYQMQEWAEDKEVRYRKEFGNKYQSKAYPMIPGIPILNRRKLKKVTS